MKKEEFEKGFSQDTILSKYSVLEILEAVIYNNTEKIQSIKDFKTFLEERKSDYLLKYDAAKTDKKRAGVVGSVKNVNQEWNESNDKRTQ